MDKEKTKIVSILKNPADKARFFVVQFYCVAIQRPASIAAWQPIAAAVIA